MSELSELVAANYEQSPPNDTMLGYLEGASGQQVYSYSLSASEESAE